MRDLLPANARSAIEVQSRMEAGNQRTLRFTDIPYAGFLETRGRTYWNISIEPDRQGSLAPLFANLSSTERPAQPLLLTIEDVTDKMRSRMHISAIHYISSAIAGPFALPQVLDRVLQALQELVGSTRCAILLLEDSLSGTSDGSDGSAQAPAQPGDTALRVTIAAPSGPRW